MRVMMRGPDGRPLGGTILIFFYGYFLLHWLTGIFMFREKLGFSYDSVVRYYLGDPEMFMNPRSFIGLLEVAHFHLFAMGLFFVIFSHLLLFTSFREQLKGVLIRLLAAAILADMAAGWLVCYVGAPFAWLKLGAFWLLQGISLVLLLGLTLTLGRRPLPHADSIDKAP
ncbi:MAG: hypothetical protein IH614_13410 [Desulfuromonadales bacterium]|nr:hypothetical protein [Desulfuromonadales bacterium]